MFNKGEKAFLINLLGTAFGAACQKEVSEARTDTINMILEALKEIALELPLSKESVVIICASGLTVTLSEVPGLVYGLTALPKLREMSEELLKNDVKNEIEEITK